jgi:hypothetical protein
MINDGRSPRATLRDLAREAWTASDGNEEQARALLEMRLRKERSKYFEALLAYAVADLVKQARIDTRMLIAGSPRTPGADRGAGSLVQEFRDHYARYLEWPLTASGLRFRDARKGDLLAEAALIESQGRTMMARRDYYQAAAERLGPEDTVGEKLDGETLHRLYTEAEERWAER